MTDPHIRILRLIAHQRQRKLSNYDTTDHHGDAVSTDRRQHLQQAATRTSARMADAQARRAPTSAKLKSPRRDANPLAATRKLLRGWETSSDSADRVAARARGMSER
jgi:hypothetical protein